MYGIELSRRAHSWCVRRAQSTGAEAVTGPFAWHHRDFVKIPPFSTSLSLSPFLSLSLPPLLSLYLFLSLQNGAVASTLNSIYRTQSKCIHHARAGRYRFILAGVEIGYPDAVKIYRRPANVKISSVPTLGRNSTPRHPVYKVSSKVRLFSRISLVYPSRLWNFSSKRMNRCN